MVHLDDAALTHAAVVSLWRLEVRATVALLLVVFCVCGLAIKWHGSGIR